MVAGEGSGVRAAPPHPNPLPKGEGTSSPPAAVAPPSAVAPSDAAQGKKPPQESANQPSMPAVAINCIGMKLVLIPPGEFEMGSTREESARAWQQRKNSPQLKQRELADCEPQHHVKITRAFYLGMYPVTQDEYRNVMGVSPSAFSASPPGDYQGSWDKQLRAKLARAAAGKATGTYPVETVSWQDAAEFCRRLSERPRSAPPGGSIACRRRPSGNMPAAPEQPRRGLSATSRQTRASTPGLARIRARCRIPWA